MQNSSKNKKLSKHLTQKSFNLFCKLILRFINLATGQTGCYKGRVLVQLRSILVPKYRGCGFGA
jgi:hypothetical protein